MTRVRLWEVAWAGIAVAAVAMACGRGEPPTVQPAAARTAVATPAVVSPALVLVPGARQPQYAELPIGQELAYVVAEPYPASRTLQTIALALQRLGYRPLRDDFLTPGMVGSHIEGWTVFTEGTAGRGQYVHQWVADWIGPDGEVVRYTLLYRVARGPNDPVLPQYGPEQLTTLHVVGLHIPAEVARGMVESRRQKTSAPQ